ncbi:hypothetical protein HRbin17_01436 [bacterium HR17]|jgi:outer membrane lipoprotein-sorting protein|uniref:Outer-membrane lipoprotein carrier protein n=1 Tax=Candidatus Fervidibacter japonicus TaxID=2035412 RepID=A0A2H5XCP9_9BACT|nr:hypothetical protein HRbin17_01436 [bacterium HR17]
MLCRTVSLGLCVIVVGALSAAQQNAAPLLDKMAKSYASATALRVRSTIVVEQQLGDAKAKQTVRHDAVFQRPNRLRVRWMENQQGGLSVTCDGKTMFTQVDALRQVKKETAPKTLQAVVRGDRKQLPAVDALSCFLGEGWRAKVQTAKVVGSETVGGRSVTRIALTLKDGVQQTLWLDKDGRIWRSRRVIRRAHPGGGTMTVTVDETFQEMTLNPRLSASDFRYTLPKGYQQVAEFQAPQQSPPTPRQ